MHVCALYQLSLTLAGCLIDVLELFLTALALEGTFAHPLQTIRHQQLQVKAQIITASSGWDFYRIGRSHLHSYYFMTCKRELGKRLVIIAVFVALSACQSCGCRSSAKAKEIGKSAICILHPQGGSGVKGIVTMHQQSLFHPLYYEFGVTGLESLKHHGVHIHEFGDLTQGCKSAGAHYNPYQKTHGGPKDAKRHAGDLGNLIANERGVVESCMVDRVTTLFGDRSIIGRSVVVHRNKDDLGRGGDEQSTKTGNAGPRIACGVIGLASKFKHFSLNPSSHQMQLQQ